VGRGYRGLGTRRIYKITSATSRVSWHVPGTHTVAHRQIQLWQRIAVDIVNYWGHESGRTHPKKCNSNLQPRNIESGSTVTLCRFHYSFARRKTNFVLDDKIVELK